MMPPSLEKAGLITYMLDRRSGTNCRTTMVLASGWLGFVLSSAGLSAQTLPRGLVPGDTIMFVAPAGEVVQQDVDRARMRLEGMGFVVRVDDQITRQRGYLAGTDEQRAEEFMRAFRDRDVHAVFAFTGGFGTTRILDRLDFDVIAANPKIMIGFSDITGLHLAFAARTGMVTFHAPNVDSGIGKPGDLNEYSRRSFWQQILASEYSAKGFTYDTPDGSPIKSLRPGVSAGPLIGGNLSLVAALMGTPYEIQTAGKIVFLEDVHEAPYRVDRMLCQLKLAGKLDHVAGIILGQFTDASDSPGKDTLTMEQVFEDYFGAADYPVVTGFPAGHHQFNATLPMGARVEVDSNRRLVRVLHSPVARRTATAIDAPNSTD